MPDAKSNKQKLYFTLLHCPDVAIFFCIRPILVTASWTVGGRYNYSHLFPACLLTSSIASPLSIKIVVNAKLCIRDAPDPRVFAGGPVLRVDERLALPCINELRLELEK